MDLKKIVQEIRKLAEKYPEAEYDSSGSQCLYTKGRVYGGPKTHGCIVGQAIRRAHPEELESLKKQDAVGDMDAHRMLGPHCKENEELCLDWITEVQNQQDGGASWGGAVRGADEDYDLA